MRDVPFSGIWWLSFACVLIVAGCTEQSSSGSITSPPRELAVQGVKGIPKGYVMTPVGLWHRSCIHMYRKGEQIDEIHHVVTRKDGTRYTIPKCAYPIYRRGHPASTNAELPGPPTNPSWKEAGWTQQSSGGVYHKIAANWTVPATPSSGGALYYTFPGLENDYYISQPVLQYGNNGWFGGNHWVIASWHVHDNYDLSISDTLVVDAGDVLHGAVSASGCTGGSCTWSITTQDVTTGQEVSLPTVPDYDNYTWATGGAVETYDMTSCNQYPINGVSYSGVSLYDGSLTELYPNWSHYVKSDETPFCGFEVFSPRSDLTSLSHNPQQPTISSLSTDPSSPTQYRSFEVIVNGSGFFPGTVQYVYAVNCWPPGGNCYSATLNTFDEQTENQLKFHMTFSMTGTVYVAVRNSDYGSLSNAKTFVVHSLY
jgi:hypothetical protein